MFYIILILKVVINHFLCLFRFLDFTEFILYLKANVYKALENLKFKLTSRKLKPTSKSIEIYIKKFK